MDHLVHRNIIDLAKGALAHFPVVVIQGVRRAGKSTLAGEMAKDDSGHVAVSLDDDEARATAIEDPRTLLAPARAGHLMIIDEFQRVPDLVLAIKAEVDRAKRPNRFILTGSSNFLDLPDIPDSLAGRAATIRVRPFSQGEIAGRKEDFVSQVLEGMDEAGALTSSWSRSDYLEAVWRGGYPEVLAFEEPWRAMWLDSYVERMTSRDAQSVSERVSAQRVRTVLRLLAANQAGELVKAHIAHSADMSTTSVTTCLDTLSTLFLMDAVPPWTTNLTKREVGRSKAVVSDPGLALHLNRVSRTQLLADTGGDWVGHALESLVITELLKQKQWSDQRWELSHYRDRNGLEVDAVVELEDGRVLLIEVKSTASYLPAHFAPMKKLAAELGDRFLGGVVLATADHGWRYTDKLVGLPISALWQEWQS